MMEEWKEYKASMFCASVTDGTHDSPKPQDRGHYLITSKHLKDNDIDFSSANLISDEDYNKVIQRSAVEKYDILYSMIGTIGNVVQVKLDSIDFAVKNMGIFKMGKDALRSTWLYYWLKSPSSREYVYQRLAGSTQSYLTLNSLREFPVLYPGDITAKKIVSILSSLDDKIEVNRKINENLEQQAQALFKSWFVYFEPFKNGEFVESELGMIPKGWKVVELQDVLTIKRGGSPRPIQDYLSTSGYRWLKISDATACQSPYIYEIKEFIKESGLCKTIKLSRGSLVLSNSATPGIPKILGVDSCIHDGWLYFPQSQLSKYYLYMLFKEKRDFLLSQGNGSVFTNLKTDIVKAMKIAIPNEKIMSKFNTVLESLFILIEDKTIESLRLAELRDTLLPKLMSGEFKVNEIER